MCLLTEKHIPGKRERKYKSSVGVCLVYIRSSKEVSMAGVRDLRESIKIMDLDRCVCGNAITVKVRTLDFTLSGMGKNQKFLSRRLSCHDFGFK